MTGLRFESPLAWPEGVPVTPRASRRGNHGFPQTLTLAETIGYLEQELKEVSAGGVLSLDIEKPLVERLRKKVGSRPGACLQLNYHGAHFVLACDRWLMPEHNIYALHLALRQWKSIERWGLGPLPVLLKGFEPATAVSASLSALPKWMEALGLGPTATLEDAVAVYHRRAKLVAHDSEALSLLNQVMDEARDYFERLGG